MCREQEPDSPSHVVGRQLAEAVKNLVALWFSAVDDVRPRLPARQIRALEAVARRPSLNVTGLAEHLGMGLPSASRLCDRLEAAGLLRRYVRPGDRREVRLEVTEQGRRLLAEVTERLSAHLADALEAVPPERRQRLEQVLRAVHEAGTPGPATPGTDLRHGSGADGEDPAQV